MGVPRPVPGLSREAERLPLATVPADSLVT
jgi:hypothetical protein